MREIRYKKQDRLMLTFEVFGTSKVLVMRLEESLLVGVGLILKKVILTNRHNSPGFQPWVFEVLMFCVFGRRLIKREESISPKTGKVWYG